jgi:hypothetical protein
MRNLTLKILGLILLLILLDGCGSGLCMPLSRSRGLCGGGGGTSTVAAINYTWTQEAYVRESTLTNFGQFGGVGISISGDTMVASSGSGRVEVFRLTSGVWALEQTLVSPNGLATGASDGFGTGSNARTIAINGDIIIIGAPDEDSADTGVVNAAFGSADNSQTSAGAAYIFERTGTVWTQTAFLKAPFNPVSFMYFGSSVAVYGSTVVVGAQSESSNSQAIINGTTAVNDSSLPGSGAVYVFRKTAGTWAQEAFIKVPDNDGTDYFGYSVAIYGDTIVAGAYAEDSCNSAVVNAAVGSTDDSCSLKGAAYVFKRTGTTWAQEAFLKPNNTGGEFGRSVAIYGDTIAVSASSESSMSTTVLNDGTSAVDTSGNQIGAVYVFNRSGSTWAQQSYLKPSKAEASHMWFGYNIAMYNDTIAVSSIMDDSCSQTIVNGSTPATDTGCTNAGSVFVYARSGSNWSHKAYLKAVNAINAAFRFGNTLDVSLNRIVVGTLGDSNSAAGGQVQNIDRVV